jgi:hypothetical protein
MDTYDRGEIVEDRISDRLRAYVFSGEKRVRVVDWLLGLDYADADIDDLRKLLTEKHGIPGDKITVRVESKPPKRRKTPARGRPRRSSRR